MGWHHARIARGLRAVVVKRMAKKVSVWKRGTGSIWCLLRSGKVAGPNRRPLSPALSMSGRAAQMRLFTCRPTCAEAAGDLIQKREPHVFQAGPALPLPLVAAPTLPAPAPAARTHDAPCTCRSPGCQPAVGGSRHPQSSPPGSSQTSCAPCATPPHASAAPSSPASPAAHTCICA